MTREESIKRVSALADVLTEEKHEATGEEVIESFLNELNAIPLVRAEKDARRCLIKVFLEDDLFCQIDYLWLARAQEDARRWILECTVGASIRRYAHGARKKTEQEK